MTRHRKGKKIDPALLRLYYEIGVGYEWSEKTIWGYPNPLDRRRLRMILEAIKVLNNVVILDIGCGGGLFTRILSGNGCLVIGLDISRSILSKVKEINPHLNLINADAHNLPIKQESISVALITEAIEHLIDPGQALREAYRTLAKGDYLIATLPNLCYWDSLDSRTGIVTLIIRWINWIRNRFGKQEILDPHLYKRTPWEWRGVFEKTGFEVINDLPIFISPWIPNFCRFLKRLEIKLYSIEFFDNLHFRIERSIGPVWPFRWLGQSHLFFTKKC